MNKHTIYVIKINKEKTNLFMINYKKQILYMKNIWDRSIKIIKIYKKKINHKIH